MEVPDPFLTAGMAFLLGCSSMYKDNVVPTDVTFHTVLLQDKSMLMYHYENKKRGEIRSISGGMTEDTREMDDIQVQMEEKGGKLIMGGQGISVKGQCRPFHLDTQNKFIVLHKWAACSSRVFYMVDDKIHAIGCNDSWDEILNSGLLDLNGKVLQNTNVKQTSMECRTDIGVDATKKVFVFEKDGCKQLGDDMKTWNQPATECTKDRITLTPGVKSPLYSLRYLLTVFGSDCPEESENLTSHGRWVDKTYVKLKLKGSDTEETIGEEESGMGIVTILCIVAGVLAFLLFCTGLCTYCSLYCYCPHKFPKIFRRNIHIKDRIEEYMRHKYPPRLPKGVAEEIAERKRKEKEEKRKKWDFLLGKKKNNKDLETGTESTSARSAPASTILDSDLLSLKRGGNPQENKPAEASKDNKKGEEKKEEKIEKKDKKEEGKNEEKDKKEEEKKEEKDKKDVKDEKKEEKKEDSVMKKEEKDKKEEEKKVEAKDEKDKKDVKDEKKDEKKVEGKQEEKKEEKKEEKGDEKKEKKEDKKDEDKDKKEAKEIKKPE